MKILKSYKEGFHFAVTLKLISLTIYFILLIMAFVSAIPLINTLKDQISMSTEIHKLLADFDFTVYSDITRMFSDNISQLNAQIIWLVLVFFLFNIFFSGGILFLRENDNNKITLANFFKGCTKFFYRFSKLSILVMILHFIAIFIVGMIAITVVSGSSETADSESFYFYSVIISLGIYLLFFAFISLFSDSYKVVLVTKNDNKLFRYFPETFSFVIKNIHKLFPLFKLVIFIPVLSLIIYFILDNYICMTGAFSVFAMFIFQQIFIWIRIFAKIWMLGSIASAFDYQRDIKLNQVFQNNIESSDERNENYGLT